MYHNPTSRNQSTSGETLNYRLRPNVQGVRLDIWEMRSSPEPGQAPYRFFVTYQLASSAEADVILDSYLMANGVCRALPSDNTAIPFHLKTLAGSCAL